MKSVATTITIVTSTFNCAGALAATAASVRAQTHGAVQWIVADGGSTDGTLDVIRSAADIVQDWFSATDNGIYDAWNKACQLIRGDWVLFLGAGDVLASPNTIARAVAQLTRLPAEVVVAYGNVAQMSAGRVLYRYGRVDLGGWQLGRPAVPAHQGVFHRSQLLRKPAPFDATYKVAGDTKLMLQVVRPEVTRYLNIDIAEMEAGGVSSSPSGTLKVMRELLRLEADLGYRIPRGQRAWYITRTYAKSMLFHLGGAGVVDSVIRLKQRLVGPRP